MRSSEQPISLFDLESIIMCYNGNCSYLGSSLPVRQAHAFVATLDCIDAMSMCFQHFLQQSTISKQDMSLILSWYQYL